MTYVAREYPIIAWEYHAALDDLSPEEVGRFVCAIQESDKYEIGHLGHIFPVDSSDAIGFIGEEDQFGNARGRFDLINKNREEFQGHHIRLLDILGECLDKTPQ